MNGNYWLTVPLNMVKICLQSFGEHVLKQERNCWGSPSWTKWLLGIEWGREEGYLWVNKGAYLSRNVTPTLGSWRLPYIRFIIFYIYLYPHFSDKLRSRKYSHHDHISLIGGELTFTKYKIHIKQNMTDQRGSDKSFLQNTEYLIQIR